ncbi:hypothetical protein BDV37DRAFT_170296 [Aspergillus pseudonomiae]|uniref:Uncharacterized protein n=1 Tax=Aspergillus pseudonomiae TaxID=1506151 RepID=A0A5N7D7A1_9EURO|nr:uncharacterized protein BDV37DRAFT_170296 [Aspergillus pseudonomiae]KAE8401803.1 hypothetical protein BDV37DRAFT_170296 [Aspergillus pseudonomiae]
MKLFPGRSRGLYENVRPSMKLFWPHEGQMSDHLQGNSTSETQVEDEGYHLNSSSYPAFHGDKLWRCLPRGDKERGRKAKRTLKTRMNICIFSCLCYKLESHEYFPPKHIVAKRGVQVGALTVLVLFRSLFVCSISRQISLASHKFTFSIYGHCDRPRGVNLLPDTDSSKHQREVSDRHIESLSVHTHNPPPHNRNEPVYECWNQETMFL